MQKSLFKEQNRPLRTQLLKWVGNKQKFSSEIISKFPESFNKYHEPFMGSAAVLASLSPKKGVGSDTLKPLVEIFIKLKEEPDLLKEWYEERWVIAHGDKKKEGYEIIKSSFNKKPNPADFLFLTRSCYGGVIRFRKNDGYMSTPCGAHEPIKPSSFNQRVDIWNERVQGCEFRCQDYKEAMSNAKTGDLVYCDPPYDFSQSILYGGQNFVLEELYEAIKKCRERGVYVALSIDGSKKSGKDKCNINPPENLFETEVFVDVGRSMLRRFQMEGETLEAEGVTDRLLLTY
jgi:DNA adenine methylase